MELGLVKFSVEEAEIAKLKAEYMPLKIDGIKDVAGYTLVHEARMEMVRRRTSITKDGKAWRDQVNVHVKKEQVEEKRLLALIEPIETHLETEQFAIDDEKKRIKSAAEEQEKKRVQSRINRLFAFGCKFDGMDYQYQDILIPAPAIPGMTDLEFESICARIESAIEKEIKEQEAAIEKFNKEKATQEAERKRLESIAKEQAEKEAAILREWAAKEVEMSAEADRIAKVYAEKNAAIARVEAALEADRRKFEEEKRLEAAKKEAAEQARIETEAKMKREAEEKEIHENAALLTKLAKEQREKVEAARQEALKPDKEKLLNYAKQIADMCGPDLKSMEARKIGSRILPMLLSVADFIKTEVKKL